MKLKKKAKMMIVLSIIANLLSGCGFGETKIEYERLVKALDEGDMKTVMSASDDGYAYVKEETSDSTYEEKEDGEHSRIIYQTTHGVYNVKEDDLYGKTTQKVATDIKNDKNVGSNQNYKKETVYSTNLKNEKSRSIAQNQGIDVSYVKIMFRGLNELSKLKPSEDTKRFSEPSIISYDLTELQFKSIINDKLNLKYDKFNSAILMIEFNTPNDTKENQMRIIQITIAVNYEEKKEDKLIKRNQEISTYYHTREDNNQSAKKEYVNYEKEYIN
ncbi:hypothetical protein CN300_04605 [Bacillus thuringiensis]|uniref:DUF3952 domain-containing protein n=1 Tax=Bacillus cereus group TaxID=86661 RepID=UPI000BED3732|nr:MULTISPECIES: DUF3952 domain-containing protein [Bacillus cereus group]MED1903324.1 DUF3952 domain-containing protein [Bacillus thuringiensis]PEB88623.1 hypothetical protein COM94_02575 [Bacillus thuringiensis]PEQ48541.1 hypothetical protein CN473_23455 [Bacillus thuringiensis]PEV48715.1 hypothetical protein CN421_07750 [Bacillus thuringiensis]PFC48057.1 hypothetical protein CN300_04605 [Bacillus thuringiensis]